MNTYTATILSELIKTEDELLAADRALQAAETRRAIALTTFAAIRDHAREILGKPPFTLSREEWERSNPLSGRFRYAKMRISDAIIDVLYTYGPLRKDDLIEKMRQGGLEIKDERAVHAATMNNKRIITEGGKLTLKPEEEVQDESITGDR